MQGLVTIDFGNTNPHAGLFHKEQNQWQLIKVVPWSELPLYLEQLQMNPGNTSMVLCEVKARDEEINKLKEQGFLITHLKDYWRGERFAGMPVNYAKTLGEDRLIQAFYAYKKLKENILIIDAGTYVTMDVVTSSGFLGGYIIPGIKQYFKSFQQGEQLKEVDLVGTPETSLPHLTSHAMRDSYIAFAALAQKLITEHSIQKVLLTGGQGALWKQFFDSQSSSVVVQEGPDLIHWALQFWMTTQIEPL